MKAQGGAGGEMAGTSMREAARLGFPVGVEQMLTVLLGTVNAIIASNLGKEAVSAIGMADSLNSILVSFFSAFAVGGTVVVAHCVGRGDSVGQRRALAQTLSVCVALALAIAAPSLLFRRGLMGLLYGEAEAGVRELAALFLAYSAYTYPLVAISSVSFACLRGAGDTRTPMYISVFLSGLNIVTSYVMIYGIEVPGLRIQGAGLVGAAKALLLVRSAGAALGLAALLSRRSRLRLERLADFLPDRAIVGAVFAVGLPSSVESILFNLGRLFSQVFLASLGTAAMAANFVAGSVFGLFVIPGNALATTATTMVGQRMGALDVAAADRAQKALLLLCWGLLVALGLVMYPLVPLLAGLYTQDPEVLRLSVLTLRDSLLAMALVWSPSFLLPAALRATGDARYTMYVAVSTMWSVRIALGYVLGIVLGLGIRGIWLAMYIDWCLRGALFYRRYAGGEWKKRRLVAASERRG